MWKFSNFVLSYLNQIAPDNVSKLSFVILYFMCMLTEIFVPCFFGSVALERSNQIGMKIYESNWVEQDTKFKQAFRLFVERTFYPIQLCVYKVFLLDLRTFLKVNGINHFIHSFLFLRTLCTISTTTIIKQDDVKNLVRCIFFKLFYSVWFE